ncbi:hypothetical protein HYPSUDRAFT_59872 [Hypholoma sublateritium FD-334 SS-4]|uniref:F-box domain-containing protein n=1 Tax=Hypholoma sublateritium (strain FD-334 SS-4) TaxID=945553 RepID=A0A0D2N2L4_HYPSF|nr:hypothetical protein HYPSUDRAFT_59872 [Hypholoma sublateritium FD-334 SS-4]
MHFSPPIVTEEQPSLYSLDEFQVLCRMRWQHSWYDLHDPSIELDLRRVEDKLAQLVKYANEARENVSTEGSFAVDFWDFKARTMALARPLLEHRQRIAEKLNTTSTIYRRLDEDIMRLIFDYATDTVQDGYSFPEQRDLLDTLPLASVARKWRNIALESAFLWSSLAISHRSNCEVFRSFLRRSKDVHLHIRLDLERGFLWQNDVDQLVAQLRSVAHRVRTLRIQATHIHTPPYYARFLHFSFPNATAISIHSHDFPPLAIPGLCHIRTYGQTIRSFSSNYGSVTFMQLSNISINDVLSILPFAVKLKTLKLDATFGALAYKKYVSNPLVHTGIHALETNNDSLMECLNLPNLKSLVLLGSRGALPNFLARSGCTLVRFGMKCYSDDLDITIVIDTLTITDIYLEVGALAHCGAVFHQLNERLDPKGRVRTITLKVDDNNELILFEDAHPYLFSPVLTYCSENSENINWMSFQTPRPHEFVLCGKIILVQQPDLEAKTVFCSHLLVFLPEYGKTWQVLLGFA